MVKYYGNLNKDTWRDDIKKGFDEAWRVLEDYGVLIFKWNEVSVKKKELLEVLGREPLFGHPNGSKIPTHWLCFMKIPETKTIVSGYTKSKDFVIPEDNKMKNKKKTWFAYFNDIMIVLMGFSFVVFLYADKHEPLTATGFVLLLLIMVRESDKCSCKK